MLARRLILLTTVGLVACSGSGSTPSTPVAPTPSPPPTTGAPPSAELVVTITPTGFSPRELSAPVGGRVTIVNNDRFGHEIWGGFDHESRDCPEVEVAGFLVPGQSRETGTFTAAKTCRFHDHTNLGNPAYQGRIFVQ